MTKIVKAMKCVNNKEYEDCMTIGKIYEVEIEKIGKNNSMKIFKDDNGEFLQTMLDKFHDIDKDNEIRKITTKEASKIIDKRKPVGSFYTAENNLYIGIDNNHGDAWTEEFRDIKSCLNWLVGEDVIC